jgi:DNA-binding LytR/AlgR family response regulator
MINIAVVDDEKNYREILVQYLKKFDAESGNRLFIKEFSDGSDLTTEFSYKPDSGYDIILLDVEMKFMNGMETAGIIRKHDSGVQIIFITNAPQYAIYGYEVDALEYILKPINYFAFSQTLDRAIKRIRKKESKYFLLSGPGFTYKIDLHNLKYIEVVDHELLFCLKNKEAPIKVRGALKKIEKQLDEKMFFRCSQGFLVNLEYVDNIGNNSAIIDGKDIPVSKALRRDFIDALNNYMSEVRG